MIAMTSDINAKFAVKVQCATCHRGVTNPAQLSASVRQTMLTKGEGRAVVQYRELPKRYLIPAPTISGEATLLDLARESLARASPTLPWRGCS